MREPAAVERTGPHLDWATLLARTFGIDALQCPRCEHGRLRPIAVLTRVQTVSRILQHLRLPLSPQALSDQSTVVYERYARADAAVDRRN